MSYVSQPDIRSNLATTTAREADRPLTICAIGYGESLHVANRVKCFADMGHRVFLITESKSRHGIPGVTELVPEIAHKGVAAIARRVLSYCFRRVGINVDHAWRMVAFVALLWRCAPDIVHVHYAYSFYGWLAGVVGCRPLVVTVMGGDILFEEQGNPTPTGKWLTLELLRQADYITSKSHHLTATLNRLGGLGKKAERIVWGVPVERLRRVDAAALRAALGLGPGQRVILSPKIMQPLYQVHLVVEAMPIVIQEFPEAVLLLTEYYPGQDYRSHIAQRVRELGLERHVLFCGSIRHEDMPQDDSLAEMTVAVPSSDGLPQALLEAMACETPNILSKLERYEEIVSHGHSAYFVETTAADIAAGMVRLLRDSALRRTIASNALRIVTKEANLDEQSRLVAHRYHQLAAAVPPRRFSPLRMWSAWRGLRRFRVSQRAAP